MRRNPISIMMRLIGLVKPLIHIMLLTILMGVAGYLCAIFITILGSYGILSILDIQKIDLKLLFMVILILGLLRGVLHYIEQASGHYIAFKLLAIIRDKVFKALRKLAPAKLEGRDKGNLIAVITGDIELLEVFYAHTIAPHCHRYYHLFNHGNLHWAVSSAARPYCRRRLSLCRASHSRSRLTAGGR